jgi:hypothetical protein
VGKLVHFQADGSTVEIKLDRQRITIGRRPDNDVCLPYPAVSGEHAAVVTILDDSFLEDLGSTNGTLVNGAAVAKHFLRDRDEIDVGRHVLVYLEDEAATLEPPRPASPDGAKQREAPDATSLLPAALRAKRRSDFVAPAIPAAAAVSAAAGSGAVGADASDESSRKSASVSPLPGTDGAAPAPRRVERMTDVEPALRVMSGAKAGRIVALVKDETLIGRAGVQVVALRRTPDEVRVVPIEGLNPPRVNGIRVVPEGQSLAIGDVLEIAGAKLELIAPVKRPSA